MHITEQEMELARLNEVERRTGRYVQALADIASSHGLSAEILRAVAGKALSETPSSEADVEVEKIVTAHRAMQAV